MYRSYLILALLLGFSVSALAEEPLRHILVFTKSAGYEHAVAYRDTAWPSLIERELLALGAEHHLDFTFTKDGDFFTPEAIAGYDAFLFYTSGDLTKEARDGQGDNYPPMTKEGKILLLRAIHEGKGFIGIHCAMDTFSDEPEPTAADSLEPTRYHRMLGARYAGHGEEQRGHLIPIDHAFPGMEKVPAAYAPMDQWYALKSFRPDLHVVMALDCPRMKGLLYARPGYPVAWARREGKGRVFYTAMGHSAATWKDPVFREMIIGSVRWVTNLVEADITPNLSQATPGANDPPAATNAGEPPAESPESD